MKIFARIFYALLLGSSIFYGCEITAPETVDPSLVDADRVVDEFASLQTETQDILNIVADVLIRKRDLIASPPDTPNESKFDDCNADITIEKTSDGSTKTTIKFSDPSCNADVTQKVRQGTIVVTQSSTLGYLDTGHEMKVSFEGFQLNSSTITGDISVKNVSKSPFTETDTLQQQLNYAEIKLQNNGTTYELETGYQERSLINGLLTRSIGDDLYIAAVTEYTLVGSDKNTYTLKNSTEENSNLIFNNTCWQNQVFFPTQGKVQIVLSNSASKNFTANVDFGNGSCDPFKTITLQE